MDFLVLIDVTTGWLSWSRIKKMTNDNGKWKMENGKSTIRKRRADALLLRPVAPLSANHPVCYTLTGSLEWVGRLLALVISDFRFQIAGFEIRGI
jgi:hypothetical protein